MTTPTRKTPIPTYAPHGLIAFGGVLGVGTNVDGWMCTVRVIGTDSGHIAAPDAYLAALYPALQTWFTTAGGTNFMPLSALATLAWVKANNIQPNGKYADTVTHRHDYGTPATGSGTPGVPWILTSAVSWTTPANRGRAHIGRVFLPFAIASQQTPVLATSVQTQMIGTGKALLNAIATPYNSGGGGATTTVTPSVVSTFGPVNNITGVKVGSLIDVQHRRDRQMVETYVSAAYP